MKNLRGLCLLVLFTIPFSAKAQDTTYLHTPDTLRQATDTGKNDPEYYNWREISTDTDAFSTQKPNYLKKPVFRLAISGGIGFRLGRTPDGNQEVEDFVNDMRLGGQFGIDLHFFLRRKIALGIEYNYFKAKNSGTIEHHYLKDKTKIQFIGPSFAGRVPISYRRNAFVYTLAIGYGHFKEVMREKENEESLTGGCLTTKGSIGYDFALSDRVALGFKLSIIVGNIKSFTYKNSLGEVTKLNLNSEDSENISTVNISVGLRFVR